jgi:CRISPR-associated Cas5-like protein
MKKGRMPETARVILQVMAAFALFSRPDSGRDKLTFQFPTPGACRGLLSSIYHCSRLEIVPQVVEILRPIRSLSAMRTYLNNITYNPQQDERLRWKNGPGIAGYGGPATTLYLYDVAYRMEFEVHGPKTDIRKLNRRIEAGAFDFPPYLGTRECLTHIVPVDDRAPVNIDLFEPAMCLSNNGPDVLVECRQGIVTFPKETAAALDNRRRGKRYSAPKGA